MAVVAVWWARAQDVGNPAAELLRGAVAARAGCASREVAIGRLCPACGSAEHGRPVVLLPAADRWRVSLSRAPGIVAVAVAESGEVGDLGIDVEEVARTAFAGFRVVALGPLEADGSPAERGLIWTRKESVLKATGLGLRTDPRGIRVSHPSDPPRMLEGPELAAGQRIWLTDVAVPGAYAATVAVLLAGGAGDPEVTVSEAATGASAGAAIDGRGRRDPGRSEPPRRR
ncbi:MAG: 4'-phosphopantetheinyl transferase superfamily protein [Lapillicoccus sp.]